jgi:hypothetical protein
MKTIKYYISIVVLIAIRISTINAQDINWTELEEGNKHFVTLNAGADHSVFYGLQYGYILCQKHSPIILDVEFNLPFGEEVMDDWYLRTGLKTKLWSKNNLFWSARASFITRRYESETSKLFNLGADLNTLFAYHKNWWGIAAEVNYDRSISTHIESGEIVTDFYPEATHGWYKTPYGNFKFGIQASATIKTINVFLHAGKMYGQDFKDNPVLPAYAKIGVNKSF